MGRSPQRHPARRPPHRHRHVLAAYVNGRRFTGDPATIQLKPHLEIALWYGPGGQTPHVPKSYRFPAGL